MSLLAVLGAGLSVGGVWGAGALLADATHLAGAAADAPAPTPLRVLMAPGGTAVAIPQFVTAPDGEVRARWAGVGDADDRERRAA